MTKLHVMPGFRRGKLAEVLPLLGDGSLGENDFPPAIQRSLVQFASNAFQFAKTDLESLRSLDRGQSLDLAGMLAYAAHMGFAMALHRYADQLKDVRELVGWRRKRRKGGEKGRQESTRRKEEQDQRIRDKRAELEAAGKPCTYDVIAKELGCSRSTVDRAINNRPTIRPRR
jgi:DNA invertase Pin-like site-specific DNA recombinase